MADSNTKEAQSDSSTTSNGTPLGHFYRVAYVTPQSHQSPASEQLAAVRQAYSNARIISFRPGANAESNFTAN